MMEERDERNESRSLLIFLAGGLIGAGISLVYAPLSGKARHLTESTRENIDHLISEIKETTDKVIEEGMELTKEKKAEILAAIEAGKKAMEEERSKIERHQTDRSKK
ncbi:MAG: YtxH domain-containing protein [Deltaproteobacteria bacterium]|nr:YtxH domain-containing protein [Deltaproteobacteria bacterium]